LGYGLIKSKQGGCDERFKVGNRAADLKREEECFQSWEIIHGTPNCPFAVSENRLVPTSPYHHIPLKTIGESRTIVSSANRNSSDSRDRKSTRDRKPAEVFTILPAKSATAAVPPAKSTPTASAIKKKSVSGEGKTSAKKRVTTFAQSTSNKKAKKDFSYDTTYYDNTDFNNNDYVSNSDAYSIKRQAIFTALYFLFLNCLCIVATLQRRPTKNLSHTALI
jgi:hypothetical protein